MVEYNNGEKSCEKSDTLRLKHSCNPADKILVDRLDRINDEEEQVEGPGYNSLSHRK